MDTLLYILQFIVAIVLIGVVLLQKSKGEGLGSIGGGAQMFFDQAKGFDKSLQRLTAIIATVFFVLSIIIAMR